MTKEYQEESNELLKVSTLPFSLVSSRELTYVGCSGKNPIPSPASPPRATPVKARSSLPQRPIELAVFSLTNPNVSAQCSIRWTPLCRGTKNRKSRRGRPCQLGSLLFLDGVDNKKGAPCSAIVDSKQVILIRSLLAITAATSPY